MKNPKIFSGSSNVELSKRIADVLELPLAPIDLDIFSDGEIRVELKENVRGSTAFIIQSTCSPANDTLMEMVLMSDALYRSSTKKIIAIIPYLGYSRQDRRPGFSRTPISARVIAEVIQVAHIDHVVTIDLHATQIQGFYNIPVDNLSAGRLFLHDIKEKYADMNTVIVSPDIGGVGRARALAKNIGIDLAIVDKRRPQANIAEVMNIIGDIEGRTCILCDDMVDTAGTLCKSADALMEKGAAKVVAYCTHAVLSGNADHLINNSGLFELVVTDTIPLRPNIRSNKIRQLTIAPMLAETMRRLDNGDSVSELSQGTIYRPE